MRVFTEEQAAAISAPDGVSLLAAAGSGKTTVLVERYLGYLRRGIPPAGILAISFTNEAADQLRARILARLRDEDFGGESVREGVRVTRSISTIHGFCVTVLNQFGSYRGKSPVREVLAAAEWDLCFGEAYRNWLAALEEHPLRAILRHYPLRTLRQIAERMYFLRRRWRALAPETPAAAALTQSVLPFVDDLAARLHREGRYGFGDLEQEADALIGGSPEVRAALADKYAAVMVDEFQDTAPIQWRMLSAWCAPERLFVVGDPRQSIYRFRGADEALFRHTTATIVAAGGRAAELGTNFRSGARILDAVNRIAERLFDGEFAPMRCGTDGPPGDFRIIRYDGAGSRPEASRIEREAVARFVTAAARDGERLSDIALLFRASDRIPEYQEALRAEGIASTTRLSRPLFDSYDVIDVATFFRALCDPLDDFTLSAFLLSPYVGFSYDELARARQRKSAGARRSLFETLLRAGEPRLSWFFDLVDRGELRIDACLQALFAGTNHDPADPAAVCALLEALGRSDRLVPEVLPLLDEWERERTQVPFAEDCAEPGDSVRLLTVHGAKGLEFEHVILVDNLRSSPPITDPFLVRDGKLGMRFLSGGSYEETSTYQEIKTDEAERSRAESRRILYVALTRARTRLTIFLPDDPKLYPKDSWGAWLHAALADGTDAD